MQNYQKGKFFEEYISYIYQLILDSETKQDDEQVILSRNTRLSKNGYSAEFDIYYEFMKAGIRHRVAIECKNQAAVIDISVIRNFHDKLSDFNIVGIIVSNSGFQEGAKRYAQEKDILLLSSDEIPNLINIIAKRVRQIFLPAEYVKGEPFYILMEMSNGELTGSYQIAEFGEDNAKCI